jgi:hypothetical protein
LTVLPPETPFPQTIRLSARPFRSFPPMVFLYFSLYAPHYTIKEMSDEEADAVDEYYT